MFHTNCSTTASSRAGLAMWQDRFRFSTDAYSPVLTTLTLLRSWFGLTAVLYDHERPLIVARVRTDLLAIFGLLALFVPTSILAFMLTVHLSFLRSSRAPSRAAPLRAATLTLALLTSESARFVLADF
eukprot:4685953-Amphidinium_carterae.1